MHTSQLATQVIGVPDVLGGSPAGAERLVMAAVAAPPGVPIVFAMDAVRWLRPYGAVLLHGLCRYVKQCSGSEAEFTGLAPDVHAYLRRIDFFKRAAGVAYTTMPFDTGGDFMRSRRSQSVLELVSVRTHEEAAAVCNQAYRILRAQFDRPDHKTAANIVTVLSEVCQNVADHSCDEGLVIAQKYERDRYTGVEIAISDLGRGIRPSLTAVHGEVADTTSGFIRRALDGLSSRGHLGHGLNRLRMIAIAGGGTLSIRSGDGCIIATRNGVQHRDRLTYFPGTQVAVSFRGAR